jgi:hypothetical protein
VADSEQNKPAAEAESKPNTAEFNQIVKVDSLGRIRKFTQGPDGKFQKKPRRKADVAAASEMFLNFLKSKELGPDGKLDKKTKVWLERIIRRQAEIATNDDPDPKAMSASTKAAEFLIQYGIGKAPSHPTELAALQKAGVHIVIVPAPQLMHPEPIEETPRAELKPSFIEGEFTTNDPTQK